MMPDCPFDEATKSNITIPLSFVSNQNYFSIQVETPKCEINKTYIIMPDLPFDEAEKEFKK